MAVYGAEEMVVEAREEKPDVDFAVRFVAEVEGGGRLRVLRMRSCFARPREMRLRICDMLGATGSFWGGSEGAIAGAVVRKRCVA